MLYKAFKTGDRKKKRTAIIKSVGYVLLACVATLFMIAIPHFPREKLQQGYTIFWIIFGLYGVTVLSIGLWRAFKTKEKDVIRGQLIYAAITLVFVVLLYLWVFVWGKMI